MKESRLLVTGCAGFIGSNLCLKLLSEGHSVIGIDNFDLHYPRRVKEENMAAFLNHPCFTFFECDLTDSTTFLNLPLKFKPEVVVHLAAKVGVRQSITHSEEYFRNNLESTANLLKLMKKYGCTKLIFASSSSVYGDSKLIPFVESDHIGNPLSPYAASKIACEVLTGKFHSEQQGDVINLRFFTVYGPGQRPDLAICKFFEAMRQGKEVVVYGNDTSSRDYTYIDDLVAGIELSADFLLARENVLETINLGSNKPVQLGEMIRLLGEESGYKPVLKVIEPQPGEMPDTFADLSKASLLLGYQPQVSFREGIKRFVAWSATRT